MFSLQCVPLGLLRRRRRRRKRKEEEVEVEEKKTETEFSGRVFPSGNLGYGRREEAV